MNVVPGRASISPWSSTPKSQEKTTADGANPSQAQNTDEVNAMDSPVF
jgi:hypothetical protein